MTDFRKLLFPACLAIACMAMPRTIQATDPSTKQEFIDLLYTSLNSVATATTAVTTTDITTNSTNIATCIAAILGFQFAPEESGQGQQPMQPPRLGAMLEEVYDLFFVDKSGELSGEPLAAPEESTEFLPLTLLTPASNASTIVKTNCAALRKALAVEPITVIIEQGEEDPVIHGPFTLLHSVVHQGSAMQHMGQPRNMTLLSPGKLKKTGFGRPGPQGPPNPPQGPGPVQQHFMRPEDYEPMPDEQAIKLKAFFNVTDTSATAAADATAALSAKDGFDNTVIHYATVFSNSKNINTSIIDPLFKKMTTAQRLMLLTAQNLWGNTPLHYAAGAPNPFSRGDAGLSRPSKTGLTNRFTKDIIADLKGDKSAAAAAITARNLAGLTPLHAATSAKETVGNLNQLISLLPPLTGKEAAGTDPVAAVLSSATDFFGNTPLHYFLLRAFSLSDESTLNKGNFRIADDKFAYGFPPPGSGYNMETWNDNSEFTTSNQKTALANAITTAVVSLTGADAIDAKAEAEDTYYESIADDLEAARSGISTKIENRGALAAALAVLLGNIKVTDKLAGLLRQPNTFGLTPLQLLKCSNPDINLDDNIDEDGKPVDLYTELHIAQALQEVSLAYLPVHFHPFIGVERVGEGQQGPGGPGDNGGGNGGNGGGQGGGGQQDPNDPIAALQSLAALIQGPPGIQALNNLRQAALDAKTAIEGLSSPTQDQMAAATGIAQKIQALITLLNQQSPTATQEELNTALTNLKIAANALAALLTGDAQTKLNALGTAADNLVQTASKLATAAATTLGSTIAGLSLDSFHKLDGLRQVLSNLTNGITMFGTALNGTAMPEACENELAATAIALAGINTIVIETGFAPGALNAQANNPDLVTALTALFTALFALDTAQQNADVFNDIQNNIFQQLSAIRSQINTTIVFYGGTAIS